MDSGWILNGYASRRGAAPGSGVTTGPTRAPNRRLPAARADNPLRAPISAVLTGARGDHARCGAPRPPCRAGHGPAPPIRRKAAPKQQRQHQAKRPGDHQDDPDRVEVEPRGGDVHREGQDGPHHQQKDTDPRLKAARLLQDASTDFGRFQPGEVLVARATAPAWTPLFARAVAVVTDGGTLAAHASLVAREYGIPAVVATGDATSRLSDGQLVTVDGGAGAIHPHN